VPVATSAFPRLAAAHAASDHDAFRRTLAASARSVLLLSALAAAALVAAARPVADVVMHLSAGDPDADPAALAWAIAAFGPGLLGYGLLALLSRALYATGAARSAAVVTTAGWAVVIVADVAFALTLPAEHRVAALAAGHTVGMTVLGVALLLLIRARVGTLAGVARAAMVGLVAAVVAAGAGLGVTAVLPGSGVMGWLGQGMLVGVVVLAVFGGVAALGDPADVRPLLRRAAGRLRGAARSNNSGDVPTEGDRR
jgi:putative peptidoglycan lipid II flippase